MTLPEVMLTTAVFAMTMAGFLAIHLFCLRYNETINMKLVANNEARNVLNRVAEDIRAAGRVRVGNGDVSSFVETGLGERQEGNAIQIYPQKLLTNSYIRYYCDTDDNLLKRYVTGEPEVVLARSVTNTLVFASEDGLGQVLSNNFNNRVISMTLQFSQNPYGASGKGFLYDYYQIRTKVTRRALE